MDKLKMETPDLTQSNIEKLAALFPACVTEARGEDGKLKKAVNFELLRQMLSDVVLEGDEAYEFTWVGKKAAIVEANRPIRKTLRPCPAESVDWDTTENLYIEGDNLEVLKLLQESYLGKVKMIYIDPPYNTGNDFIYRDDFAQSQEEYSEESGQVDENGDRLFKNTDSNGRFHSDWCSMIYSRLMLARNLLSDDGVIVLDFFSGSATTAHAIMQLNAEDSGNRRFIMVQIPEKTESKDYSTLCEIGKERIRRAGEKILQSVTSGAGNSTGEGFGCGMPTTDEERAQIAREVLDVGFRVFKLDDTSMTDVYYSAGEYDQSMLDQLVSNIKPDRTDLDLLFGCLLE